MHRDTIALICLRTGLGLTFLWIGIDMMRHADLWIGYIPAQLPFGITRETGLQITALLDSLLGVVLILGFFRKIAALIAAAHLAGILVTQGIDAVLIRDVGLLGASLALAFWPTSLRRRW